MPIKPPSKFDKWFKLAIHSGPLWITVPVALLSPWPLILLLQWLIGNLTNERKTDWWAVFAYPLAFGIVVTHFVLMLLGSYSWQRGDRRRGSP